MHAAVVRAVDIERDAGALAAIDTSFTTAHVFKANVHDGIPCLAPVEVTPPIRKRFPLRLDNDPRQECWVIADGRGAIVGFSAVAHEPWNRRLVFWHYYVDLACRRRGFGRLLMDRAIARGRDVGAMTVWAETSNVNYPGILAYRRMGFEICGFDLTHYLGTPAEGEFAVFLSRAIDGGR